MTNSISGNGHPESLDENYYIYFGYSKQSKFYPQALELASLAPKRETFGAGSELWHLITLTTDQIDLMAALYLLAIKLPFPVMYGESLDDICTYSESAGTHHFYSEDLTQRVAVATLKAEKDIGLSGPALAQFLKRTYPWIYKNSGMIRVGEKLGPEGWIQYWDPEKLSHITPTRKPRELIPAFCRIQELVAEQQYIEAVDVYYKYLDRKYYGELTRELIYLKRLGKIELAGRDLLYFRSHSSRGDLIRNHLAEYIDCIDEVIIQMGKNGDLTPLRILLENLPTMEQMIERRTHEWHNGVYLRSGEIKRDNTPVILEKFSTTYDGCPEGRLFDRYTDVVWHCRILENNIDLEYQGVWVKYSKDYLQANIYDKGLHLNLIDCYRPKAWRMYRNKWRTDPAFQTLDSLEYVKYMDGCALHGIEYTGQTHSIDGDNYYEVNLSRNFKQTVIGNAFSEAVEDILREAENHLREGYGLPRIGEGWISETLLFKHVHDIYPDAVQHGSPEWIRPQHLDVFVPSINLALEYQGQQHFMPLEFFGGEEAFLETVKRDQRKAKLCKKNNATLITWHYDEPISASALISRLATLGIS